MLCIVGGAVARAQARILKRCLGGYAALREERLLLSCIACDRANVSNRRKIAERRCTLRKPTVNGLQEGGKACACTALYVLSFGVGDRVAMPTGLEVSICVI